MKMTIPKQEETIVYEPIVMAESKTDHVVKPVRKTINLATLRRKEETIEDGEG